MLCEDWDFEFTNEVRYLLRLMGTDQLKFYGNQRADIVRSLEVLSNFDRELYKIHHKKVKKKSFTIRYREFDSLCKKYIKQCQNENNHVGGYVFFSIFEFLRPNFKVENSRFQYDYGVKYRSPATEQEKKQAIKYIDTTRIKNFDPNRIEIMRFKNFKFYVYEDMAYYPAKKEVKVFDLDWDWWYNIEHFIYLERGWGEKSIKKNILA